MRLAINSCFVAFVLPSSSQFLAMYNTPFGFYKIKPQMYATKRDNFGLHPPPAV